jgi:hypothetical protein
VLRHSGGGSTCCSLAAAEVAGRTLNACHRGSAKGRNDQPDLGIRRFELRRCRRPPSASPRRTQRAGSWRDSSAICAAAGIIALGVC